MELAHYVIVRRDLPLGVLAAMVTHAAGESAHRYGGVMAGAVAVVLEAKNEAALEKAARLLRKHQVQHTEITEADEFMAIGLVPCDRKDVEGILRPYQTLKSLTYESDNGGMI